MQKKSNTLLWLILVGALAIGGGYYYKINNQSDGNFNLSSEVPNAVLKGKMSEIKIYEPRKNMPSGIFLQDLSKSASLQNIKGQWTLVNLWASWCPPCLAELPSLQKLNDTFSGQGFRVIAISLDAVDTPVDIDRIVNARKLGSIARNWDHTGELFKLISSSGEKNGLPISFIVDPNGKVYGQLNGEADWATPDAIAFVDSLLGRAPKKTAPSR